MRELDGPPGAPTVVLLHGLVASGGLNWFSAFRPLARHFRVVAPDLRGHGRGLRSRRRFTLAACADDTAAMLTEIGTGPVVAVGYSMGGPVAQLLWKRHPEAVSGLVLCATSDRFVTGTRERLVVAAAMTAAAGTTRVGQSLTRIPVGLATRRMAPASRVRPESMRAWASAEMRRHDLRMLAEAAHAVGTYDASRWIADVDVPTAVLVTTEDRTVAPEEQRRLAASIPGARTYPVNDGHLACAHPGFARHLVRACLDVVSRTERPSTIRT